MEVIISAPNEEIYEAIKNYEFLSGGQEIQILDAVIAVKDEQNESIFYRSFVDLIEKDNDDIINWTIDSLEITPNNKILVTLSC